MKEYIIKLLAFIPIISILGAVEKTEYFDNYIHLPGCTQEITTDTPLSTTTPRLTCTGSTPKINLGKKSEVLIHSILFTENLASITDSEICQKSTTDNLNLEIKQNVKQILFSVNNVPHAIVVGTAAGTCPSEIDVPVATLESGYVEVKTVKCIEKKYLTKYEKSVTTDPKPFVVVKDKLCFLNPSLTTSIHVEEKGEGKDLRFTISAYPNPECPKCKCHDTIPSAKP